MDYEKWLLDEKGIRQDTLNRWGVEITDDAIKYHYPEGIKTRRNTPEGRKFSYEGKASLYRKGMLNKTVFIVEGENDLLRLDQEFFDAGYSDQVSVVGLSGVQGWKREYANDFRDVEKVRIVLDQDEDYKVRGSVDQAFARMATDIGRARVRRIYLPETPSDICDFFKGYSLASFLQISKPSQTTNYNRLDLNAEPPVAEWLLDGLICKGDITLMTGPPNIGKSFITMGLALAVAEGWPTFLGQPLRSHGPVLCIDEENPVDVVYSRLLSMGMTAKGKENLHYYHRQGVRLDLNAEKVLDDALIIKPALITIDAMTRVHSQKEDDAGSINKLFNEAIIPLGRETGAAVIVIHAIGKGDRQGWGKTRGSSDFEYAIDNGIEVSPTVATDDRGQERDALSLSHFKSRRTKKGARFQVFLEQNPVGDISLEVAKDGFE